MLAALLAEEQQPKFTFSHATHDLHILAACEHPSPGPSQPCEKG